MLNLIGMGGTFDHLHEGHKYLLRTALSISQKVTIGLTTPKMFKSKKFASKIEDYEIRKKHIEDFIKSITKLDRVKIIELNDPYGPPIHEPDYEGLIASQETYEGALEINKIREQKGFDPLIIIIIPILRGKDKKKYSSTAIREKL